MNTNKPISVRLSKELASRVEKSRAIAREKNTGAAIRRLLDVALQQEESPPAPASPVMQVPTTIVNEFTKATQTATEAALQVAQNAHNIAQHSRHIEHHIEFTQKPTRAALWGLGMGLLLGVIGGVIAVLSMVAYLNA